MSEFDADGGGSCSEAADAPCELILEGSEGEAARDGEVEAEAPWASDRIFGLDVDRMVGDRLARS